MGYSAGSQAEDQFWICHRGSAELIRVPRDQGDSKGASRSPRFKHWMNNNDAFLPVGPISPTSSSHEEDGKWKNFFHFLSLRFSTAFSPFSFLEALCSHHAL